MARTILAPATTAVTTSDVSNFRGRHGHIDVGAGAMIAGRCIARALRTLAKNYAARGLRRGPYALNFFNGLFGCRRRPMRSTASISI
jgi:hypothetical protein